MPLKKLRLTCRARGARGTEKAKEMLELMTENWSSIQENFQSQEEQDREDMLEHFNDAIEELGDQLFGEDASVDNFDRFVRGLDDNEEKLFMEAVNQALLLGDAE